ncbi:MAG: MerR family transcriptional regulator [Firmicutes bacterium]|nr:MerR family transcriptional regulator [Bacillota bacterium]
MKTVSEVEKLTGVSVRTLHHYHQLGLLPPTLITDAGYRLYDDAALRRLQTILLFRELQFPLKEIKEILDRPGFDPLEALQQQIELLELRKAHIEDLIALARSLKQKGVPTMDFKAFDTAAIDSYKEEVKEKWGKTEAYARYEEKAKGQNPEALQTAADGLMALFAELGSLKHLSPAAAEVQSKVKELQNHITAHFYPCTDQILAGLGQMYTADPRFRKNIDAAGGEGTAEFAARAIAVFTDR